MTTRSYIFLVVLVGCGGDPFTADIEAPLILQDAAASNASPDASPADIDSSFVQDSSHILHDAMRPDVDIVQDSSQIMYDSALIIEASPLIDAGIDAGTCGGSFACGSSTAIAPGQTCVVGPAGSVPDPIPAACLTCATYTCDCLSAHGYDPGACLGHPFTCADSLDGIMVMCQ